MIEDPRINFAISNSGGKARVDHLGIQTESEAELVELRTRAQAADMTLLNVGAVSCRYARSDKYWLTDPQGIAWEQFHTLARIPLFSEQAAPATPNAPAAPAAPIPQALPVAQAAAACYPGCASRGKPVAATVAVAQPSFCC